MKLASNIKSYLLIPILTLLINLTALSSTLPVGIAIDNGLQNQKNVNFALQCSKNTPFNPSLTNLASIEAEAYKENIFSAKNSQHVCKLVISNGPFNTSQTVNFTVKSKAAETDSDITGVIVSSNTMATCSSNQALCSQFHTCSRALWIILMPTSSSTCLCPLTNFSTTCPIAVTKRLKSLRLSK